MIPFLNATPPVKGKQIEDKSIERLFGVYDFVNSKIENFEYNDKDLYETETFEKNNICDIEISQNSNLNTQMIMKEWVARLFRVTVIILEILLNKVMIRSSEEFIEKSLKKFPENAILYNYSARLHQLVN